MARKKNDEIVQALGPLLIDPSLYQLNHKSPAVMEEVAGAHVYTMGEHHFTSVTTVLQSVAYNEMIVKWANNLGFRHIKYASELERTAKIGTAMHTAAQSMVDPAKAEMPHVPDPITDYYVRKRAASLKIRLELEQPWHTYFTETPFVSVQHEIAGTIDWFAQIRGSNAINDFKSASGMREKFLFQLGGYSIILDDNGIDWDSGNIWLCKEENTVIYHFEKEDIKKGAEIFLRIMEYAREHDLVTQMIQDAKYLLEPPKPTTAE